MKNKYLNIFSHYNYLKISKIDILINIYKLHIYNYSYILNDDPQLQVITAFGLITTNLDPSNPS